jgi:hypothetical protein
VETKIGASIQAVRWRFDRARRMERVDSLERYDEASGKSGSARLYAYNDEGMTQGVVISTDGTALGQQCGGAVIDPVKITTASGGSDDKSNASPFSRTGDGFLGAMCVRVLACMHSCLPACQLRCVVLLLAHRRGVVRAAPVSATSPA